MYRVHILADYVVTVLAPESAKMADLSEAGESVGSSLPEEPWRRLREGACALYGACTPLQV